MANRAQGTPQHDSAGTELDKEAQQVSINPLRLITSSSMTRNWALGTLQKRSRTWQMSQQRVSWSKNLVALPILDRKSGTNQGL